MSLDKALTKQETIKKQVTRRIDLVDETSIPLNANVEPEEKFRVINLLDETIDDQ